MKAIAVDDEPMALEVLRFHASKVPFLDLVSEYTDAFKAMEYLQRDTIDLIFLDIKMPDISGIEFLNSLNKKPLVIFTTAYSEHAVISFELDAIDYLLKPFSITRFMKACNKAYELFKLRNSNTSQNYLFLKTGYEHVKVEFDDICYLEATGNYVTFVLNDKKHLSRMTISEAESILPTDRFIRVHRSFIVARNKIEKAERHQLHTPAGILPIGNLYLKNIKLV